MIEVRTNEEGFAYDIHSLVRAFYPKEEVKVFEGEDSGEIKWPSDAGGLFLVLEFSEGKITFRLWEQGKEKGGIFAEPLVKEEMCFPEKTGRAQVKNYLKQLIYRALFNYTGKILPWGTLTGIRPTKIPMGFLEEGRTEAQILKSMQDTYFISKEKGSLCIEIARREKQILADIHYGDGYSLYVGIPFCPTTCLYCSFTSYPIASWRSRVREYLQALEKELLCIGELFRDKILDSVYIGGGTPTTLTAEELDWLLHKIKSIFNFDGVLEFTVEAGRADSITPEKLRALKRHGVNRISINPQTMNQKTLDCIGRKHTVEQVIKAFHIAREEGFTNINMDMILGLPEETETNVQETVEAIKKLEPDSLTVHSLAIKRASGMNRFLQENGMQMLHDTEGAMEIAKKAAEDMGMKPYYLYRQKNMSGNLENVGYAKEGCYGLYNILIMEEKQTIAAAGPGSISKLVTKNGRIERRDNVKDVGMYIERIDEMLARKRELFGNP